MWRIFQVVSEWIWLVVAAWLFAATFEPLRSRWRAFGNRPVKPWAVVGLRILTAIAFILGLTVLVLDLLDLAGFIYVVEGR